MEASLFSWWGLIISVAVVVAILAIAFLLVRAVVRWVRRRRRGSAARGSGGATG
ncbi:hypothetical protein M0722_09765 [Microbacterium sp. KSW4-16]|uniref:Uncharacterized protein n=1 Tax=Microbacterium aurugineum TaxID=2851642 RepID=A0ABY4J253_9MICO|nr:hypothetical protein [Microbacterium aurugineum]MCK8467478.1 hypothetical protein [Microbacterium aurugineum]UPL19099.1 hypothetical protein KV397_15675 [Microbacterium aurugineum]